MDLRIDARNYYSLTAMEYSFDKPVRDLWTPRRAHLIVQNLASQIVVEILQLKRWNTWELDEMQLGQYW